MVNTVPADGAALLSAWTSSSTVMTNVNPMYVHSTAVLL